MTALNPLTSTPAGPLALSEELHVLLLDRQHGGLVDADDRNVRYAFAGAALMDLSKENRIDTDMQSLTVVDSSRLEDDILDPLLTIICTDDNAEGTPRDTVHWIERLAAPEIANQIRRGVVGRLIARGILTRDPAGEIDLDSLVKQTRRYPGIPMPEGQDVVLRIINVIFSDDIPSPDESMLVGLVDACGIFKHLLSQSELAEFEDRIALVAGLDMIGRSIRDAILTTKPPETEEDSLRRAFPDPSEIARRKLPPMVPGALPWVGHSLHLRPYPTIPLSRHFRELGPVFRIRDLGRELTVLAGPEANVFCQKRGRSLFRSYDKYTPMFEAMDAQRVILSMDGKEHSTIRQAISSGFSADHYLDKLPRIKEIVVNEIPENRIVPAARLFSQQTAKSIALACTGYEMSSLEVENMDFFVRRLIATRMLGTMPQFLSRAPSMRRARDGFFSIFTNMLNDKLGGSKGGVEARGEADVLDKLLDLHRSDPQFLPERELRIAGLGPVFAGLHTTASTGAFAMWSLIRHPEIFQRVQAEADVLHGDGGPTPEKLHALDVTGRVVLETLRMYNPFLALYRTSVNTFDFGGYTIPAGTRLFLPVTVPHYCPEFFPQPERFDIDRYLPERHEHTAPGCYVPFGFGTHRCLGKPIAELHLRFALATMLHHFNVELVPPRYKLKIVIAGVPEPSSGFKLRFTRRR